MKKVKRNKIVEFKIEMKNQDEYEVKVTRRTFRSGFEISRKYKIDSSRHLISSIPWEVTVLPLPEICDIYKSHSHWYLYPSFVLARKAGK